MCDVDGRWHGEEVWYSQRSGCSGVFWQAQGEGVFSSFFRRRSETPNPPEWLEWIGIKKMLNRRRFGIVKTVDEGLNTQILHIQVKPPPKKRNFPAEFKATISPAESFSQCCESVGVTDYFQHVDVYFTFNLTYRKKSIYTYGLKHLLQHILPQLSE